jgi:ABC-2 type transport system permease protein
MLLHSVFLKTVRDLRWPVFWAGLGLGVLGFYFIWLFPTFMNDVDLQAMLDSFPPAMMALVGGPLIDLSTPAGFLNMELFPLMLPIILGGFAITLGSGATAAEESRGTLDVLLSEPVQRWRVVTEKAVAMTLGTAAVAACLFVGVQVGAAFAGVSVPPGNLAGALLSGTLLALAFGSLALALGCWTGNRALAIGLVGALFVVTYFINALAPLVEVLDDIQAISPFFYYLEANPVRNGIDWTHAAVLATITAVGFAAALVGFERRDLAA